MKQKNIGKLMFNKSTVANLGTKELKTAKGGGATRMDTCDSYIECTHPAYCPTFNTRVCRTDRYWC